MCGAAYDRVILATLVACSDVANDSVDEYGSSFGCSFRVVYVCRKVLGCFCNLTQHACDLYTRRCVRTVGEWRYYVRFYEVYD